MTSNSGIISYMLFLGALVQSSYGTKVTTVTFAAGPVWTVGAGVAYTDMTIGVGEHLKFSSYSGHDVQLLHAPAAGSTHWNQCGSGGIETGKSTTIWASSDFSADSATAKYYTPPTCGVFYIACGIGPHCIYGQRIKVTVGIISSCTNACSNGNCVTANSKPSSMPTGTVHDVKASPAPEYWGAGATYGDLTLAIGDKVIFQTSAGFHDVATVPTEADYTSCEKGSKTIVANWKADSNITAECSGAASCCADSSCGSSGSVVTYTFKAETAGVTYFICSVGNHCKQGQQIKVTVGVGAVASSASRFRAFELLAIVALAAQFTIA